MTALLTGLIGFALGITAYWTVEHQKLTLIVRFPSGREWTFPKAKSPNITDNDVVPPDPNEMANAPF